MASLPKKVPPPPPIAVNDPTFNHWLHDLTAFIQEGGGVDTGAIPGFNALVAIVANHTTQISALTTQQATNTSNIAANTADIATNAADIATLNARSQVFTGTVAPVVGLGINGDWYSNTVAKHIYVKTGGVWTLIV